MFYYVVFQKDFIESIFGDNEFQFLMYTTDDLNFALTKARHFNKNAAINLNTERFIVYEFEKLIKKYTKKDSKKITQIYPSKKHNLF